MVLSKFGYRKCSSSTLGLFQGRTNGWFFCWVSATWGPTVTSVVFEPFPASSRKLYVLLSVLLCLLISGLVVFFLFPHSVLVDDGGIKVVQVWFDKKNSVVVLAITVKFLCPLLPEGASPVLSCPGGRCYLSPISFQATLRIRNSNFYSVAVTSLTSQVQYMNTVVGSQQITNVSSIQPLSDKLVFVLFYTHNKQKHH